MPVQVNVMPVQASMIPIIIASMMPIQASMMSVNKAYRIPVQAWVGFSRGPEETFKSYIAHLMVVKRILYLKQEGYLFEVRAMILIIFWPPAIGLLYETGESHLEFKK